MRLPDISTLLQNRPVAICFWPVIELLQGNYLLRKGCINKIYILSDRSKLNILSAPSCRAPCASRPAWQERRARTSAILADFGKRHECLPHFGGLVLGCTEAGVCKQIFVLQHFVALSKINTICVLLDRSTRKLFPEFRLKNLRCW